MQKILIKTLVLLTATLPFWILGLVFFLKDPPVMPDEVTFFEISKSLIEKGVTATGLLGGSLPEVDKDWLGYRFSLYFHLLGNWTKYFGESIEAVRALSLISGFLALVIFFLIAKHLFRTGQAFLGTVILSLNVIFGRASRFGRMEIFTLLQLLLSFYLILLALSRKNKPLLVLSGILAASSSLTHPVGLIAPAIIFLTLFTYPNPLINALWVFIPAVSTYVIWIALNGGNVQTLLLASATHLQDKVNPKLPYAWVLFTSSFSWRLLFIAYALTLLLFVIRRRHLPIIWGLIFSASAFILGKEGGYMVYFQPFIILALLVLPFRKMKVLLTVLIVFSYLNISFLNNDNLSITSPQNGSVGKNIGADYYNFTNLIASQLPGEEKAVVFISAVPDPYFGLKSRSNLAFLETIDPSYPFPQEAYTKLLDSADYLVVTWFPHRHLADYAKINGDSAVRVSQEKGYWAEVIKLKPRHLRI